MAAVAPNPPGSPPSSPVPSAEQPAMPDTARAEQPSGLIVISELLRVSTTPGWLRAMGAAIFVALALFALAGARSALTSQAATNTIEENIAPSLIEVQNVFASVAEANAAATAAFLGDSRAQRNLYLDAVGRAARQSERVSSLVGDQPAAHAALQDLNADLIVYSGQIEASRAGSAAGTATASSELAAALDVAGTDVADAVGRVTLTGQAELQAEQDRIGSGQFLTLALGVLALAALVTFQYLLIGRTNRLIHPWLVLATVLLIAAIVIDFSSISRSRSALEAAETGGLDSITSTAALQSLIYEQQTDLALGLLGVNAGAANDAADLGPQIDLTFAAADSPRERAAVQTLQIRAERYAAARALTEAQIARGELDLAAETFRGETTSPFNGLNTSIESVLGDNRAQFIDGAAGASSAVRWLPVTLILLPLLSALCVFLGVSRRLREFR